MHSTELKSPVRSIRSAVQILLLTVATLLVCIPMFSQGSAGRILGAITDQTGGVVSGATVSIIDTQRNLTRTLTTDNAGEYNAPNLLPGTYTVRAAFQGFKTAERSGIILEVNQDLRVDLTLQPGEQTERVTVTEALPMVETTNAELGGTLQSQIIDSLPLNGRNFENLLQLRPGVTIYPGGSGWTQSTNGQRAHDNVYLFEGVTAMEPLGGQSTINSVSLAGDAASLLAIDTIQEFSTQQNAKAEYGWKPCSVTSDALNSGTNEYHGTGNFFGRTDRTDARNPFLAGDQKQQISLKEFGGTIGGPIKKDKIFFFGAYEGQRYTVGNPAVFTYPSLAPNSLPIAGNTTSLLAACNTVRTSGRPLSPTSLK